MNASMEINVAGHGINSCGKNHKCQRSLTKKDLTKFIIKFKRRERWEMFKAEHHDWIERVNFDSQNISQAVKSFNLNGNGAPKKMVMHFEHCEIG